MNDLEAGLEYPFRQQLLGVSAHVGSGVGWGRLERSHELGFGGFWRFWHVPDVFGELERALQVLEGCRFPKSPTKVLIGRFLTEGSMEGCESVLGRRGAFQTKWREASGKFVWLRFVKVACTMNFASNRLVSLSGNHPRLFFSYFFLSCIQLMRMV